MNSDLSQLTVDQLQKLAKDASSMIKLRQQQDLKDGYAKIEQIAQDLGVSLDELLAIGRSSKATRKASTRKPVEVRYRNSADASQTWTGRGKQPRWLVAAIAAGASKEDFLISA
ncbi:MAG: H-NS histone family protein [Moraxellaceae bacterium]